MNIVLIGMRGSGKTTVGKILAKKLQKPYIEMDDLIVKKAKMKIPKIVKEYGWGYFRDIESHVVREVSEKDNCIIATGGGVVLRLENVEALKKHGKLFWLQGSVKTLSKRIGDDENRPLLTGILSRRKDMEQTLKERKNLYEKAADGIVDTENTRPENIANEIVMNIEDQYVY